jgi:hypothetical protein
VGGGGGLPPHILKNKINFLVYPLIFPDKKFKKYFFTLQYKSNEKY